MVAIRSFSSGLESRQLGTPRRPSWIYEGTPRYLYGVWISRSGGLEPYRAIQMIHYQPPMNPIEPVRPTRLTWRST